MPLPNDADASVGLSVQQAFQVMTEFLWKYARQAGDDLVTLLGDIELESYGSPTDPAAWEDWLECVDHVKAGLRPRRESP